VQLTIALHPKGGREPFSFVMDNAITYPGLAATLDWHNCGPGEPHSIAVISGDGQTLLSAILKLTAICGIA